MLEREVEPSQFKSGIGTETDPYIIMTADQLRLLATFVNTGTSDSDGELYATKAYKLGADIELNKQFIFYSPSIGEYLFRNTEGGFIRSLTRTLYVLMARVSSGGYR